MSFTAASLLGFTLLGPVDPPAPVAPTAPIAPKAPLDPTTPPSVPTESKSGTFAFSVELYCTDTIEVARRKVMADGSIVAHGERGAFVVVLIPTHLGTSAFAFAVSKNGTDPSPVARAITDHIKNGADDPKAPASFGTLDASKLTALPELRWTSDARPHSTANKFFIPVAALTMEKHGLVVQQLPNTIPAAIAGGGNQTVLTFLTPGENVLTTRILVLAFAADGPAAEKLSRSIFEKLVKTLYE
jgi:hypothetical protein